MDLTVLVRVERWWWDIKLMSATMVDGCVLLSLRNGVRVDDK